MTRTKRFVPWWWVGALAILLLVPALVHEPVFGNGGGAMAAASGVLCGLTITTLAARFRWDLVTTTALLTAAHLLVGGAFAVGARTWLEAVPSLTSIAAVLRQTVESWRDLLTLQPPASDYSGPAVVPWTAGLVCAAAAGLLTLRWRWPVTGTLPMLLLASIGVVWGPSGVSPAVWPALAWFAAVVAWWAAASQSLRVQAGQEILVGRRAVRGMATDESLPSAISGSTHRRVTVVRAWRRLVVGLLTLGLAGTLGVVAGRWWAPQQPRLVARDLVSVPLDVKDFPTALAAYRHYVTTMAKTPLVEADGLPKGARLRLAAFDSYNGITFAMSGPDHIHGDGYTLLPSRRGAGGDPAGTVAVKVEAENLVGPWLPSVGQVQRLEAPETSLTESVHVNPWADTMAVTGKLNLPARYTMHTIVDPMPSDGELQGLQTAPLPGVPDTRVPDGVEALAKEVSAAQQTPLAKARAIEQHLSKKGFWSTRDTPQSRSGHRADRLARMLTEEQMVGDDEQYAALMALMLHSLDIPARIVMGLHGSGKGAAQGQLRGFDVHVWVEVPFEEAGWATFDPSPPRDQQPKSKGTKPKSVPRPQVLQPPDPPERPVELPPSTTERAAIPPQENPLIESWWWWAVAAGSGLLILLAAPVIVILALKAGRRRSRRRSAAATAVVGAWDESIDLATDVGITLAPDLTRREAATVLASRWWPQEQASDGQPLAWRGAEMEPIVELATHADEATFAAEPRNPEDAAAAWAVWGQVRKQVRSTTPWGRRLQTALSMRSWRRRRALARAARKGRR